jgi:hypothetical protein
MLTNDGLVKVACPNCDWHGTDDELDEYHDFWSRIAPGDTMPHGDCPECGAFCYEAKPGYVAELTKEFERFEWINVRARKVKWSHLVRNRVAWVHDTRHMPEASGFTCRAERPASVY